MRRPNSLLRGVLGGLIVLAGASGQAPTGTIAGIVMDATGATVAQARVVVRNPDSGLNRTAMTKEEGSYSAASLPAGSYELIVEAAGFSKLMRTAIVEAGTTTTVNL